MEALVILILIVAGIWLLSTLGLLDLARKTVERSSAMADRTMEVMDAENEEKHSRKLGKVAVKWADDTVARADAKTVKTLKKQAFERMLAEANGKEEE